MRAGAGVRTRASTGRSRKPAPRGSRLHGPAAPGRLRTRPSSSHTETDEPRASGNEDPHLLGHRRSWQSHVQRLQRRIIASELSGFRPVTEADWKSILRRSVNRVEEADRSRAFREAYRMRDSVEEVGHDI